MGGRPCIRKTVAVATAIVLTSIVAGPLRAGTVLVTTSVPPVVDVTLLAVSEFTQDWDVCFPFVLSCPLSNHGTAVEEPLQFNAVTVGFTHFFDLGTNPCPCQFHQVVAYRGEVIFRTADIPHHFVKATLVLDAKHPRATPDHNFDSENLVTQVLENASPLLARFDATDAATLAAQVANQGPQLSLLDDPLIDRASVDAPVKDNEFTPIPSDPTVVQIVSTANSAGVQKSGANFRIDVTDRVRKWVADWPHQDALPAHAFFLVGPDESMPTSGTDFSVATTSMLAEYAVTLEFQIDEPDF